MAISFVNKGTWGSGTSAISPGLPASMQAGDFCLLFIESANEAISITNNGSITWTQVTNSPVSNGVTAATALAVRFAVYYGWYSSGTTAPTIADSGNHTTGIIMAFRGVDPTTPFDATPVALATETTARTALAPPGITTATDNAMVIYGIALDADVTTSNPGAITGTPTNANLTNLTLQHAQTISSGVGGGIGVITGFKATAGSSGAITGATTPSSTHTYLTMALRPQATFDITVTIPTESTITISEETGTIVTATADASITIPTESTITISEINGTTITVISNATIIVPSESTVVVNNDNPIVTIIANITITVPTASSITINEGIGTVVAASTDTIITISTGSSIQLSNDNPLIEAVRMLMTISPTSQLQVYNLFVEGAECSLAPDGTLTMIEFIEGAIVDFNSTGTLTAFEFIEGGM